MATENPLLNGVAQYISECESKRSPRQWISIGFVMLDHLLKRCPLDPEEYVTRDGGEITNSRSSLGDILEQFGVDRSFLTEATTRSNLAYGHRFAKSINYGSALVEVGTDERRQLVFEAADLLKRKADHWVDRQQFQLALPESHSPSAWVAALLQIAAGKSGGRVEQHLVGAKLEERHPEKDVGTHSGHAGDLQTERSGDFQINKTVYHVTSTPTSAVIRKCADNRLRGLRPILITPRSSVTAAIILAKDLGVSESVSIRSLEEFIDCNVTELSDDRDGDPQTVFRSIIERYNQRIDVAESDPALRIEIL